MSRWCLVCGTIHESDNRCRGDLPATGPEVNGWRVKVETPQGVEAFGVLIAPCHEMWRARIVTHPNMLWTLPGGRGTLKFLGRTREEAEGKAAAFIGVFCSSRGYLRGDQILPAEPPETADSDAPSEAPVPGGVSPAPRKRCRLPAKFGVELPEYVGMTVNMSRTGLFVGTALPLRSGEPVCVDLRLNGDDVHLRGFVMWHRRRLEVDRPPGMGVRLINLPQGYPVFVERLA